MRLAILLVTAATLLAGCALSPQTVTLTPTLNLGKEVVAHLIHDLRTVIARSGLARQSRGAAPGRRQRTTKRSARGA